MAQRSAGRTVAAAPKAAPAAPAPPWLRVAVLALAAVAMAGYFATPVNNPDAWWQLATGRYIWQQHKLPVPDPFAYTTYLHPPAFPGEEMARYFNLTHEWLAQIVFYLAYAIGGFGGLVLFRSLLLVGFCAMAALVVWRRTGGFYRSIGAALLAASVAVRFAQDRPFLITFLFLGLLMALIEYRRWLWIIPPLFVVWANCHGGFFMGWVVLGAYCAEALFLRWRGKPVENERTLYLVTAASVLLSGLNPNGFHAIGVLLAYRQSKMQMSLWEWHRPALFPLEAFGVVLFAALATLAWVNRRVRVVDLILFAIFALSALTAVRNVILVALIGPIIVGTYFPWKRALPAAAQFLAAALLVAASVAELAAHTGFQFRGDDYLYPSGAADFILAHHLSGPMLNTYEFGGYLIWRLWPQQKVFIDGRALSETVFNDYERMIYNADNTGGASGAELLDRYAIQTIVMDGFEYASGDIYLLPVALSDPSGKEWKLVYRDAQAVIFMRNPPPDVQPLNSLEGLAGLETQCQSHMQNNPQQPGCARSLSGVFEKIGDAAKAREWMAVYQQHAGQ